MSATFLLAHISDAGPSSALSDSAPGTPQLAHANGGSTNVNSKSPSGVESGHTDAIWCSKWAKLTGTDSVVVTGSADHTIKLWNPSNGSVPQTTIQPPSSLGIVSLDVDNRIDNQQSEFIVTSSLDSVISRFSLQGEAEGRKELGPGKSRHSSDTSGFRTVAESWAVSLSPKSMHMVTAGDQAKVKIMSSSKDTFGEVVAAMEATGNFASVVQYSQSGRLIAVAADTGYVTLFDSETGQLVSTFPAHSSPIRSLSFTSSLLVTGSDDKRINVFDMRAITSSSSASAGSVGNRRGQVASLGGHEGWVTCVQARNDRLLASGSADGTIKLFDLASPGAALNTLRDHTGDVWTLAWCPEQVSSTVEGVSGSAAALSGGHFVSGGEDGKLRWWRGGG
ncbi:Ski complex subunit Rec14 [Microbotryomycetes sp. JL201]|nr:Ski complex subunit Rec14 [Microbotryomycetes sp. JL201]